MHSGLTTFSDADVLAARPSKNRVDPRRPYAFLVEPERSAAGRVVDVATVFLTNRECPFRCVMCDLWRNTLDVPTPSGAIPQQIEYALERLPAAQQIKLYNSGNFFDAQAIPRGDWPAIARLVRGFERVIVENHPRLCSQECVRFAELLGAELELALGLETVHPQALAALNKRMTLDDFDRAVEFLLEHNIAVRSFILLPAPYVPAAESVNWTLRSLEHAFAQGVECCSVIATRANHGVMEQLEQYGAFAPPTSRDLEQVLEQGIRLNRGRLFLDLWEIEEFFPCPRCGPMRRRRLHEMNLRQIVLPSIPCDCGTAQPCI
jgi:radical SAM enzyme (TIGR01210 family)